MERSPQQNRPYHISASGRSLSKRKYQAEWRQRNGRQGAFDTLVTPLAKADKVVLVPQREIKRLVAGWTESCWEDFAFGAGDFGGDVTRIHNESRRIDQRLPIDVAVVGYDKYGVVSRDRL